MKLAEIRRNAFAMPLNDPAYPPGPYKFYNREFVVITYRTDIDRVRAVVPEPLEVEATQLPMNSSACRTRPALATTPKRGR
jgi:acetoacetate decarboxylase